MSVRRLNPYVSACHFFGAELRYWRELRGYSQSQVAREAYVSDDLIRKVECGERWPTERLAIACDDLLQCSGVLVRLQKFVASSRAPHHRALAGVDRDTIAEIVYRVLEVTGSAEADMREAPGEGGRVPELAQHAPSGERGV